jgi:glycine/D-amino acid oxidase-like deaminating enzyme
VNDITLQEKDTVTPFRIHTSKGIVKSRHVIHATNGYAAHLLPGLRAKLFPVRGQMTTQRAGDSFPFPKADSPNPQSWSIHHPNGALDYIIQRPVYWKKPIPQVPEVYSDYERRLYKIPPRPPPPAPERLAGELYVGGGLTHARHRGLDEIGVTNDDTLNLHIGAYLAGLLPFLFSSWGEDDAKGRVIRQWTGIMGFTVDLLPFVGRLGEWATGRKAPTGIRATTDGAAAVGLGAKAVTPGEWIAAGYNGEGMVHAWLCGVGVGMMVMGQEDTSYPAAPGLPDGKVSEWLPHEFLVTKERLEKRSIYDMATML